MGQSHHTLLHLELVQYWHTAQLKRVCPSHCQILSLLGRICWQTTTLLDDIIINKISSKATGFLLVDKTIFISSSTVLTARLKTWTYNKVNMIINSSFWYSRIKEEGRSDFDLFSVYCLFFGNKSNIPSFHQSLIFTSSSVFKMMMAMLQPPLARFPRRCYLYQTNNAHPPWSRPYLPTCHHS